MSGTLVLVGGGGHCRACIDVIAAEGRWRIHGILEAPDRAGTSQDGVPVIGTDADMEALAAAGHRFLVTVGQVKSPKARLAVLERLAAAGARLATVRAPSAVVSPRAALGEGTIVMHQAVVNAGARVGRNAIVNTRALLEHDSEVGEACHVSTGAILNGGARLGDRSFLGSGAVVVNQVSVGPDCVIGAGSVVTRDLGAPGIYAGVPARKVG